MPSNYEPPLRTPSPGEAQAGRGGSWPAAAPGSLATLVGTLAGAAAAIGLRVGGAILYYSLILGWVIGEVAIGALVRVVSLILRPVSLAASFSTWIWNRVLFPISCLAIAAGFVGVLVGHIVGYTGYRLGLFSGHTRRQRHTSVASARGSLAGRHSSISTSNIRSPGAFGHQPTTGPKRHTVAWEDDFTPSGSGGPHSSRSSLDADQWIDWTDEDDAHGGLFSSGDEPSRSTSPLISGPSTGASTPVLTGRDYYVKFAPAQLDSPEPSSYPLYEDDDGYITPGVALSRTSSLLFTPILEEEE